MEEKHMKEKYHLVQNSIQLGNLIHAHCQHKNKVFEDISLRATYE